MLFELFKNSMRAVMEYHSSLDQYPPITVTVAKGKEDICLKVMSLEIIITIWFLRGEYNIYKLYHNLSKFLPDMHL